jgi:hypothetical protein
MRIGFAAATMVIAVMSLAMPAAGQRTDPRAAGTGMQNHLNGNLTQEQFDKLQNYATDAKRLTKEDKAAGKTLEQVLAEDKAAAAALVTTMPLSCAVVSAMKVAAGPETVDGQTVQTTTYEAACSNGMGYFLISQAPAKPYGFSCFASDATAKADTAAGRKASAVCLLPENSDLKTVAGKMLAGMGFTCKVKDYRWIGQNAANHIEFNEVACDNGQGYIMRVALPGATIPVTIETCNQSAKRGLACKLSDNGDTGPSLASFREALAKNHVSCAATDATTRVIGEIKAKKQYVVEFACPMNPKGVVAYIPQADSTTPFEALDCATAAKRGAICVLAGNKN